MATSIKDYKEHTLEVDMFGLPSIETGVEALARRLNTLILMDKGTMPNDPDMGVGISSYQFEQNTGATIAAISDEISRQRSLYLTDTGFVVNVVIEKDANKEHELIIEVSMISAEYAGKVFALTYKRNDLTSGLTTRTYI